MAGPGARGAFLEIAGERALDWRPLGSRPAWAAPVRASKRGCAVRSGLSKGPGQVAGEHSFVRGLGEACAKGQRRPVALAALRKESPMTDLITAARDGNGPRVEVAPHMVVAEFRGLGQLACCCRSVASTRASRFHGRSFHLGLFSYRSMQELLNDAAKAGNLPEILRAVDGHALPTLLPNFGFVRAAVRLHARLFTPAVVALLLGGTGGGRYASTDRVCQHSPQPLFSRHLRSFKKTNPQRLPPGTASHTRWPGVGTQCEGYPLIGAHPRRNAPPWAGLGTPP